DYEDRSGCPHGKPPSVAADRIKQRRASLCAVSCKIADRGESLPKGSVVRHSKNWPADGAMGHLRSRPAKPHARARPYIRSRSNSGNLREANTALAGASRTLTGMTACLWFDMNQPAHPALTTRQTNRHAA